jgi:predicted transcriptional regulator
MINITEGELLQAWQDAISKSKEVDNSEYAGFMTKDELTEALGVTEYQVKKFLKANRDMIEGKRVPRKNLLGEMSKTPAYRLKGEQ